MKHFHILFHILIIKYTQKYSSFIIHVLQILTSSMKIQTEQYLQTLSICCSIPNMLNFYQVIIIQHNTSLLFNKKCIHQFDTIKTVPRFCWLATKPSNSTMPVAPLPTAGIQSQAVCFIGIQRTSLNFKHFHKKTPKRSWCLSKRLLKDMTTCTRAYMSCLVTG